MDAIRRLTGFLFISLIVFGIWGAQKNPGVILTLAIILVLTGAPLFVYGVRNIERYKEVFDYEPTTFWGKMRNGKEAREVLMAFNMIGLWCFLAGAILLIRVLL